MHPMMDKKSMLRKKAMDSMMKEGPSIAIKIAKKSIVEPQSESMEGQEKEGGLVSMLVSPEEKKMIEEMRNGGGEEQSPEGMELEQEEA